ncbi:MAG: hypothetical protein AAGL34_02320 [Bacteroidota bacterium]
MILTLKDATFTGDILNKIQISVENERTTVKDLISARVEAEVKNYNEKLPEYFKGLVQPTEAEKTLNGFRLKKRKSIDVEKQILIVLDAFLKNGFFILIDDQQAESLEQEVLVGPDTEVHFVKLTQLVGG